MFSPYAVEVIIFSADGLQYLPGSYGPNGPYVVIWVDPNDKSSTHVSEGANVTRPCWNETLVIPLLGPVDGDTTLFIHIVHPSDEENIVNVLGCARLNLREVVRDALSGRHGFRSLTLKSPSGRRQGKVYVKVTVLETSHPPPPPAMYNAYYAPPQPSFWERITTQLAVDTIFESFKECLGGDYYDGYDYSIL